MTLQDHFSDIKDPRQQYKVDHKLIDILVLSIIAVICGADEYKEIEVFGNVLSPWIGKHRKVLMILLKINHQYI